MCVYVGDSFGVLLVATVVVVGGDGMVVRELQIAVIKYSGAWMMTIDNPTSDSIAIPQPKRGTKIQYYTLLAMFHLKGDGSLRVRRYHDKR